MLDLILSFAHSSDILLSVEVAFCTDPNIDIHVLSSRLLLKHIVWAALSIWRSYHVFTRGRGFYHSVAHSEL